MTLDEVLESYQPLKGLRANFVVDLEGEHKDSTGSSRGISSPEDKALLVRLRQLSDVVLVSAKTAVLEQLSSTKASTLGIVVGAQPLGESPALAHSSNRVIVFAPKNSSHLVTLDEFSTANLVLVENQIVDRISPTELLNSTRSLDLHCTLSEFGPEWLGQLDSENLLDELCLTVTKKSWQTFGVEAAVRALAKLLPASTLQLSSTLQLGDTLFTRWHRTEV